MSEAFAASGLVSTSVTETGGKIIRRLEEAKNGGGAFDDIAAQLTSILETLEALESESVFDKADQSSGQPLLRAVQGCQRQVKQLESLLDSCLVLPDDGKTQKDLKALRATTNEKRIRSIQYTLETYETTLIRYLGQRNALNVDEGNEFIQSLTNTPSIEPPPSIEPSPSLAKSLVTSLRRRFRRILRRTHSKSTPSSAEQKIVKLPAPSSAEQRIVKLPALQIPEFVSRLDLNEDLNRALVPSDPPTVIWLHGMGGQGKTQIALERCRQLQRSQAFKTIIWIDASSKEKITAEYSLLLNRLSGNTPPSPDIDQASDFQQRLEDWPEPFLLVFDGCDRPAALQEMKLRLPTNPKCVTLCTSRFLNPDQLGRVISVPPMSNGEAYDLLSWRCLAEVSEESMAKASQITEELGHMPLAVDQAASYIKASRLPLTSFLEAYESKKDAILRRFPNILESLNCDTGDEQRSSLSVYATWELTYRAFIRHVDDSPDVRLLLSFLASFQYENIPESVCRSFAQSSENHPSWASSFIVDGQWDSGKYHDFAARLAANSLITGIGFEDDDMTVSLHPLVQEWIRHQLPAPVQQPVAL
ncbi:MAG: hypothetical protein OHK93_004624 [Ramalina farinacea]|uniref:NB-ARC domain-containing protein n=1 Tax=Ramalina farinacea TaxID=258253 RepID=A0AA43TV79_9LECA|nr:hypothetical protein [Ramalina farinacea]